MWWALLGCAAPVDVDLWTGPNHLLPLYLELDEDRPVAWSFSRMHGTLARIDTTSATVDAVFDLPDFPPAPGRIVPAPEGVWVLWDDHAVLFSDEGDPLHTLDKNVLDVRGDRIAVQQGVIEDGVLQPTAAPPLRLFDDGVALLDDGSVLGPDGVICTAPFASRRAAWDGRSVFVVKGSQVGRCGGITADLNEPKTPVLVGDALWVLDRIGRDDPNVAEVRVLDPDTLVELDSFPTGKNSGYGGWDGATLWVNSEGSTEVLGLQDGAITERIRMGVHVESVSDQVISGRLSNRLWTTDGVEAELTWPVAPRVVDGRLYVVSQLTMHVVVLDPETLQVEHDWDLGLGDNPTLTLSDLAWWQGSLWLTDGARDALVRIDEGVVTETIPLGEPLDPDASGRLELVVSDDALYVIRARDARVHRVDGQSQVTGPAWVDLAPQTRMQLGAWDDGVLWVGPVGLDGETLEPVDGRDWTFFVGRHRGHSVAWAEGLVVDGERIYEQDGEEPPEVSIQGGYVVVTDIQGAAVRSFEL